MATPETEGYVLDVADCRTIIGGLLARHPDCVIGLLDPTRTISAAGPALADIGIDLDGHAVLTGTTLSEFVAVSDSWIMSEASVEARERGSAARPVELRGGQRAALHLVAISDNGRAMIAIIVPGSGETVPNTPPPSAIEASPRVGVLDCDAFGIVTCASPSIRALLGRPATSVEGTPVVNLIHPDDCEMAIVNWSAAKEQRGVALRWRCRVGRTDGTWLWVEATITNGIEPDGRGEVRIDLYDISVEIAATEALVAERELVVILTEALPVGVAKFDGHGRVEHANQRLAELLSPLDPCDVLDQAFHGALPDRELAAAFADLVRDGVGSRLVIDHLGDDGVVRHLEWTLRAALGDRGEMTGGVVCIADVTEADRLRAELVSRANTDALTGCLNRAGTIAALQQALTTVEGDDGVGLLFIDLDAFKGINDSYGHAVGDAVLEIVASRLRCALRPGDLVGRLGGDEFVVISPGMCSARATLALAERISTQLQLPAAIAGLTVAVHASIGVAWTSTGTADELLGSADAAMYTAKQSVSDAPVLA